MLVHLPVKLFHAFWTAFDLDPDNPSRQAPEQGSDRRRLLPRRRRRRPSPDKEGSEAAPEAFEMRTLESGAQGLEERPYAPIQASLDRAAAGAGDP